MAVVGTISLDRMKTSGVVSWGQILSPQTSSTGSACIAKPCTGPAAASWRGRCETRLVRSHAIRNIFHQCRAGLPANCHPAEPAHQITVMWWNITVVATSTATRMVSAAGIIVV
ncbi:hypothetical protein JG688_00008993 [Phytophthora aleatoria]|uniref:Uncharacterized protein n=1 Tax=Phytophthora aleatoria TaxID=2496075 RepID=A0A8J5IQD6_9STRA|nr:hypothetical protein JG688_00008993 [Phytophthora aleatoria]